MRASSGCSAMGPGLTNSRGRIHAPPLRGVALAMHEPIGVVGVACPDEAPLLGFVSLVAPLIAMGNRVVVVPSEKHPLAATDFYQVLETSDVPAGVVNIVTGGRDDLVKILAEHDDVDALWVFGSQEASASAEAAVDRQSQAHTGRSWPAARLVRQGCLRGSDPATPCRAGEEHLDSLWRLETSSCGDTDWDPGRQSSGNFEEREEGNMLKSINPLLNADVLYALRAMGHGDSLVICDTNFPAELDRPPDRARRSVAHRQRQRCRAVEADSLGAAARYVRRRCGCSHGDHRPAAGNAAGSARSAGRDRSRRGAFLAMVGVERLPSMKRPRRPIA